MPELKKKKTENSKGAEAARSFIQRLRDESGGMKPFYRRVYGCQPVGNEHIKFNNQINRGNYSEDFVALLTERFSLEKVTLGGVLWSR